MEDAGGRGADLAKVAEVLGVDEDALRAATQTLKDTLASYTLDNAWAEFAEDTRGRLKEGMDADIAVLSHDLTRWPAETITDVNAITAIMDGQITFQRAR